MFEGGGFGVGLTVRELGVPTVETPLPPGVTERPMRLSEALPARARTAVDQARELEHVQVLKAMLAAYEADLVLGLAAHRPEAVDPAPGTPGVRADVARDARSPIPGTSEFFVDELALVTNSSPRAAAVLAEESFVLVERLPAVWAALADGVLDWPRARVFVDVLKYARAELAAAVAARLLPEAAGLSLGRLRARLKRAVLAVEATFAEDCRAEAERCADVRVYPTAHGMSELATEMPSPLAAACWSTVDELASMIKDDGDPRPIGQLRAGVLADLILRPWDDSRPAVTANLTVVAPLASLTGDSDSGGTGSEPGEVNGQPITTAHVRELLAQLDALCPGGLQAPRAGSLQIAVTTADGVLLATTTRPELQRIARRGCADHGAAAGCSCAVLDRPPRADRYRPTPAQRQFVKQRDRTCRHPGCGQPVARVDLDHVDAYADGGATDCDNLCCLCRRHHRLKTHAAGWRFVLTASGVLRVTTPSGITRTTRPPGLADRIEQRALPAPPPPPGLGVPTSADPPPF